MIVTSYPAVCDSVIVSGGGVVHGWSGDDWQTYCDELLTVRYGTGYQRIPDSTNGDHGAEGFTDDGTLFQAYACEEVSDSKKITDAQRRKVNRDIAKVMKNRGALSKMVGKPIRRMVLMVPDLRNKDLVEHCGGKAKEVQEAGHEEFSDDFDIRVLTADDFKEERRRLGESLHFAINLDAQEAADEEIDDWTKSHSELAASLDRKLGVLPPEDKKRLGQALVRLYLRRERLFAQLRQTYPALWETLQREIQGREHTLAVENMLSTTPPDQRVAELTGELEDRIVSAVPNLRTHGSAMAWGTVAEWLLRCPLELEPGAA